jgi:hypothetical protein
MAKGGRRDDPMPTHYQYTAVGTFGSQAEANRAIEALQAAGFRPAQIGVAVRASGTPGSGAAAELGHKAGEGAAVGAAAGGAGGALAGALLSGLIPGVGPVIAGGLLSGLLGGSAVGAAAGAVAGALVGLGLPEEEARFYDREFLAGRVIVAVEAGGRSREVAELLRRCGARRASAAQGAAETNDSYPAPP